MRADQEIGHRAPRWRAETLGVQTLLVTPLHFAGADRRAKLGLRIQDAGVFQRLDEVAAIAEPGADFGDDDVADDDGAEREGAAQGFLRGFGALVAAEQVDDHRGIDRDHLRRLRGATSRGESSGGG